MSYKKPPKSKRFKPGQSGNPKGRLKGIPELRTILIEEFGSVEGMKSKLNNVFAALYKRSLRGDPKAAQLLIDRVWGKAPDKIEFSKAGFDFTLMSDDDLQVVLKLMEKYINEQQQSSEGKAS